MDISLLSSQEQDFFLGNGFFGALGMENLRKSLSDAPLRNPYLPAYHVLFTAPHREKLGDAPFSMTETAQWTARLSALCWRRYNGPIHLITDREGARYIRSIGLDKVYDSVQEDLWDPYGLNQRKFWASGKLLALKQLELPCVILDMDLVVWKPLTVSDAQVITTHTEEIDGYFYPGREYFLMSGDYNFPADWDDTVLPLNTSVLYLNSRPLKEEYLREAFRFMRHDRGTPDNGSICMIFAEQRILAFSATRLGIRPETLLGRDITAPQDLLTHTWNAKSLIENHPQIKKAFLSLCREKCAILEKNTDTE